MPIHVGIKSGSDETFGLLRAWTRKSACDPDVSPADCAARRMGTGSSTHKTIAENTQEANVDVCIDRDMHSYQVCKIVGCL